MTLGNEKIDQIGSFACLGSVISEDGGSSEDVKSKTAKAQSDFSQLKKVWKNRKTTLKTKIRILEGTVLTGVKYGSGSMGALKSTWRFTRCFPEKFPTDYSEYPAD